MLKRVLQISQKDALNVEKNADKKIGKNCMMQFVPNVVLKLKYHLDRNQIEKFYVENALKQVNKILKVRIIIRTFFNNQ